MTNYQLHERGLRANSGPQYNRIHEHQLRLQKHPMHTMSGVEQYRSTVKYQRRKPPATLLDRMRHWVRGLWEVR